MGGFKNGTLVAKNADYTQSDGPNAASSENNGLITNGQLWIGSTALNAGGTHINVGNITSTTLTVGYSSPNITIETTGGAQPIEQITVDNSTAPGTNPVLPTVGGNITITGGQVVNASLANVIQTHSVAANSFAIQIQRSDSSAAADTTKNGVSHFNSSQFSVASTGFVSITSGGFTWVDATGATQALLAQTGYVTDRGGGVTYTLPASGTLGDIIKIVGKLGIAVITPNANQQILIGSVSGTVGVAGTATANNVGDCIELVCITAGAASVWRADSVIGTWTLA